MASGTDIGSAEVAPEEPAITEASGEATDVEPADEAPSENSKGAPDVETSAELETSK